MSVLGFKIMYMLVMFDLPVKSDSEKKYASSFRNFLKKDGFIMMQYSIYIRPILSEERYEKHIARVKKNIPPSGVIHTLRITDLQFRKMSTLISENVGNRKNKEEIKLETLTFWD